MSEWKRHEEYTIEELENENKRLRAQIEAARWLVNIEAKLDKIIDGLRQLSVRI